MIYRPTTPPGTPPGVAAELRKLAAALDRATVRTVLLANLPPPGPNTDRLYIVSDAVGGAVLVFSDGTNWRRVTDRAVAS